MAYMNNPFLLCSKWIPEVATKSIDWFWLITLILLSVPGSVLSFGFAVDRITTLILECSGW